MNARTIGLVQTNTLIGKNLILPLAIGMLWSGAMTVPDNRKRWSLQHICYLQQDMDQWAAKLSQLDVVAMSMYIWNADWQMQLAHKIKILNPNCFVVVGGPHVTGDDDSFWPLYHHCVDLAFLGEADHSFRDFLRLWPSEEVWHLPGLWRPFGEAKEAPRVTDLGVIPSPYLTGFYDDIIATERQRQIEFQVVLQTNRGCPYHCTFCEIGKEYKNKIHLFDFDQVKQEIEWCGQNQITFVGMADDNWGIMERDLDFMRLFCETKQRHGYPKILDATFAKNAPERVVQLAKIDIDHGTNLLRGITMSLQSTNHKTLEAIKRFNLVDHKRHAMVSDLKKMGMPMYSEIVWPLPYETLDSFLNGLDQVVDSGVTDWCAVYPLSIHRSADLYDDHVADYFFSNDRVDQQNLFRPQANIMPYASRWAGRHDVIRGHVVYNWLASLYYFGWARPALIYLRQHRKLSWTAGVTAWLDWLQASGGPWHDRTLQLEEFYDHWLQHKQSPKLYVDAREGIEYWNPFTHLAHWINVERRSFYENLRVWLAHELSPTIADSLTYISQHHVIDHDATYPKILRDGSHIDLVPEQLQFQDAHESSTYYFWHRRKKGLHYIDINPRNQEWHDLMTTVRLNQS